MRDLIYQTSSHTYWSQIFYTFKYLLCCAGSSVDWRHAGSQHWLQHRVRGVHHWPDPLLPPALRLLDDPSLLPVPHRRPPDGHVPGQTHDHWRLLVCPRRGLQGRGVSQQELPADLPSQRQRVGHIRAILLQKITVCCSIYRYALSIMQCMNH